MTVLFIAVAAVILIFFFFGRPNIRFDKPPTHEVETASGRTTLYHYRSKWPKGRGEIVMVHGLCENHLYFERVVEPLNEAGYDCYAINLFGYGGSLANSDESYTVEAYADQVREVCLELRRLRMVRNLVAVWGHSMGGAAVFHAAPQLVLQNPELNALVLENPGFGENLSVLMRFLRPFAALATFKGPRVFLQVFVNLLFGPSISDPTGKRFVKKLLVSYAPRSAVAKANVRSTFAYRFKPEAYSPGVWRKLYFVFSQRDRITAFARVERHILGPLRARDFPEERLLLLPQGDHFVSLQDPEAVAQFVLKHLERKAREAERAVSA